MYELHFDALFRNAQVDNCAGVMCIGWLVHKNSNLVAQGYGITARGMDATSNVAEYVALIDGLQALMDMGLNEEPITIIGDAKAVINQMKGTAKVNSERILPMHRKAMQLVYLLNIVAWEWVPRGLNKDADLLSRRALREFRADPNYCQKVWTEVQRDYKAGRDRLRTFGGMMILQPQVN